MVETLTLALSFGAAILSAVLAWKWDRRRLEGRTPFRAALAYALIALSTWVIAVIVFSRVFQVPSAYGQVQFLEGAPLFFYVRRASLFLCLIGLGVALLVIVTTGVLLLPRRQGRRWTRGVIPLLAVVEFAVAFLIFVSQEYYLVG